ncbi:hypothetical protein [Streptomyces lienomycini]|uniref:Lipoprotein n=1 Tax=Streptomyces lienomycini TaxID=284035 RepID=A0ABV9WVP1_9ACTN|nr:hypothetical protein [Streptomyces lienomycini]
MRPLYVPVRLAATAVAVVAAAGCMSVGDESGGDVRPSHSAGERGGEAPEGGPAVSGGTAGYREAAADEGHGEGKKAGGGGRGDGREKGEDGTDGDASASASSAGHPSRGAPPKGGDPEPEPTRMPPEEPTRTAEPEPTPTQEPPAPPTPEPTVAEPSSSAHEPPGTQLEQREPAPAAGAPV